MVTKTLVRDSRRDRAGRTARDERPATIRDFADRMFSRAAGAQLTGGNHVRLLVDGRENYPAWLAAIHLGA